MSDRYPILTCQRCGIGFVLTDNYRAFLTRWGVNVVVPVQCLSCFWEAGPMPKQQGRVKWFDTRKKYGFIVTEKEQEIFFHRNQLLDGSEAGPREGQAARFHVGYVAKGPEALNVELVRE